jgi:hypothetical protein
MERKRMGEIGIALVIILALMGVIWLLTRGQAPEPTIQPEIKTPALPAATTQPPLTESVSAPAPQVVSASTVARIFVERIGSYSSESDYQNVNDVQSMVTSELAKKLTQDAEKARAQSPTNGGYYGISTSYVGSKAVQESETSMTLLVQTQREESFGSPGNSEVRYQTIELTLVLQEDAWKVSAYTWGD